MLTRENILNKIQTLTKNNGGKTPSEKNFYEYVEIGIYDLHKLGWVNYGELVHEAGLTPNKFDKTKYSHEQLCELFVGVIREKGRWPTRGQLDVKHHHDSHFPDSATFYKKLGLTKNLAKTILNFGEGKRKYDDVKEICDSIIKKFEDRYESDEEVGLTNGYVYLGKQHGDYKIGKARNANRRREDITLLGSEPFELIHEIKTDDMIGVEKYWHNRFKTKLKRGEWFNLSPADIKAFKRWKKIT